MQHLLSVIAIMMLAFVVPQHFVSPQHNDSQSNKNVINDLNDKSSEIILDIEHPNRESMEYFLNHYKEEFLPADVDWPKWENEDLIQYKYAFLTHQGQTSVYLIFCKTQKDAIAIGEKNFSPRTDTHYWGVNGGVLVVVSGKNKRDVNSVLGLFGGEE